MSREYYVMVAIILGGCSLGSQRSTDTPIHTPSSQSLSVQAPTPPILPTRTLPSPTLDIAATLLATVRPRLFASYPSPDGLFRAEVSIYDCTVVSSETPDGNALEQLLIFTPSQTAGRLVDSRLVYCGGLGAFGLAGLFWTPDNRYFYYTDAREGVPDGCGYWERSLLRVRTTDWTVESIGSGPLSPDGTKIAAWEGSRLLLWHTEGKQISAFEPPVADAIPGPIAWSPDSSSLVYLLSEDYCPLGETYLVRLDLALLRPALLLSSAKPSFADVAWQEPHRVTLHDEEGHSWTYDLRTGQLESSKP